MRAFVLSLLVVLTLCTGCQRRRTPVHPTGPKGPLAGVTVLIDPGHGGQDSGAVRGGMREDVLNYRMASLIASELVRRGANVGFTVRSRELHTGLKPGMREPEAKAPTDARLVFNNEPVRARPHFNPTDLWRRAAAARPLANTPRAYFLSIHADALGSRAWWGARVYRDVRDKRSSRLAESLQRRLTRAGLTFTQNGQVIPRDYGVLNPEFNPITQKVLIELWTISSPHDRVRASLPSWRWKAAKVVADAIAECEGR